ncbi:MAG: hypothetical protein WCL51_07290 [Bacteroidota bacterium]
MKTCISKSIVSLVPFSIFTGSMLLTFLLVLMSNATIAQSEIPEISFIKLNNKIGIVIDSIENHQCKCVNYYEKEEYNYSVLMQLPDSNIVLRIMLKGELGFRDLNMDTTEIKKLYTSALTFTSQPSVIDSIKEEEILRAISGDTVLYKRIDYSKLKFKTYIKPGYLHKTKFTFFNIGLGTYSNSYKTHQIIGAEIGFINKNNMMFTFHGFIITELKGKSDPNYIFKRDYSLLVGKRIDINRVAISISYGFAAIFEDWYFDNFAFPIEAELFIGARKSFNFSLIAFCNYDLKYFYYNKGLLLCIRFGKVKNRII